MLPHEIERIRSMQFRAEIAAMSGNACMSDITSRRTIGVILYSH